MKSKITVISTVRNEIQSISIFIDSILAQSTKADEIVVVDGNSSDGTNELLQTYEKKGKIKLITQECNIAQGRNLAIQSTTNEIIAITDAGCRPDTEWLNEITKPLMTDSEVDAVSGKIIPESETKLEHYCGLLSLPDHKSDQQANLFYGRCCAFRRSLWESIGGYPEWLYTAEDSLFALSAQNHGFKVSHNENAIIHWRPRNTLKKIAKMFFLYGKGNGRINWGNINGTYYWLKYHALFIACLFATPFYPIFSLLSLSIGYYIYRQIAAPSLKRIRKLDSSWYREIYVPLITYIRNLSSNLGYLCGYFEFKNNPIFKLNLDKYLYTKHTTN